MVNTNTLRLSYLQRKILSTVARLQSVSTDSLATILVGCKPEAISFADWRKDIEMQCCLFTLREILIATQTRPGVTSYAASKRLLQWRQRPSTTLPEMTPFSLKRIPLFLVASSFALTGCSSLSWLNSTDSAPVATVASSPRSIPHYNPDGWLPPDRMEQFITPGKGAVYRYCTTDCPEPTPKLQRVFSSAPAGAPRNLKERADRESFLTSYNTDAVPQMAHSAVDVAQIQEDAQLESVVAEAEAYLRDHPLPPKKSDKLVLAPEAPPAPLQGDILSSAALKLAKAIKNSRTAAHPDASIKEDTSNSVQLKTASTLQAVPTVEKTPAVPKAKPLKTSSLEKPISKEVLASNPTSGTRKRVVFTRDQELLNAEAKTVVGNLADAAMEVETVLLRGYASNVDEQDNYHRLSVARSISVKDELVKAGVPREKIRILQPKYKLVDPNNPMAAVNSSVVVMFKSSNASVASLNSDKAQTQLSMLSSQGGFAHAPI